MPTTRRTFLKLTAAAASIAAADLAHAAPTASIAIHTDSTSPLIQSEPVQWALAQLHQALAAKGIGVAESSKMATLVVAPASSALAKGFRGIASITQPETTALIPGIHDGAPAILVTGVDARGLVYGLTELAERVRLNDAPLTELHLSAPLIETTPNKVRSIARAFLSEIDDKAWFYDRAFWTSYLDTIASARFNRFNFALGFGWDFPRGVTGDYLHFPYPYLVELPAYPQVHVEPLLAPGERQHNLDMLRFIAAETARRGMDFQLGLWTHAYEWTDSPHSDHHIVGLTPETHAPYCRDSLSELLKLCPQITGVTLRIHGESGIPEGSYPFWQTLFEAVTNLRTADGKPRPIEIDMHAKGLNQIMIDMARKTGNPVKAGAKYWAEHQGLGYHQADIRAAEIPKPGHEDSGVFALSSGSRSFTRYGYGDFYQQNIGLDLLYRVWPGTQHHLLWADPALASGYGRSAHFCGAAGMELCEPLTFKGREGSGHPGGRNAYADRTLASPTGNLADLDTNKFALTYLTWGRFLYNPDTAPEVIHRAFRQSFGNAGPHLEAALSASSRILPLVTTAWLPSASNHELWLEMLTPVSILPITGRPLYTDSPAPHNVSAISPLDPQLFTTIDQHARDLVTGEKNHRYNTSEVMQWLESFITTSTQSLAAARTAAGPTANSPEFRRVEEDLLIVNGLGTYFAETFRAALYYSLHVQTQFADAATRSVAAAHRARESWAAMATRAQKVYVSDISYGSTPFRRGHWADRLQAIDANLAALEKYFSAAGESTGPMPRAMEVAALSNLRPPIAATHMQPAAFHPGSDLNLSITIAPTAMSVKEAILWYRHVNQGERWLSTPMQHNAQTHTAAIPAAYTNSPYPLQYYFELHTIGAATLHPPFNPTLSNQPYFAIHLRS